MRRLVLLIVLLTPVTARGQQAVVERVPGPVVLKITVPGEPKIVHGPGSVTITWDVTPTPQPIPVPPDPDPVPPQPEPPKPTPTPTPQGNLYVAFVASTVPTPEEAKLGSSKVWRDLVKSKGGTPYWIRHPSSQTTDLAKAIQQTGLPAIVVQDVTGKAHLIRHVTSEADILEALATMGIK